ncbi:hypothetical protein KY290_027965 [Solanum tuberosum]|uniref:Retrotransposon gag domain-containing protein n=1 Tax=Solanum tuberosum TaxID=4113 RepID=A0ABQ7UID1_SOLTU|nr:hypothetical protein KY290_027965 [Solanum tuberosum]
MGTKGHTNELASLSQPKVANASPYSLAEFVNGTIERPKENSQDLQPWIQGNAIVLSWLKNAIAMELQGSAAHVETAREIWVNLEERFTQGIAPTIYELKRDIALLQQERASISSYYD